MPSTETIIVARFEIPAEFMLRRRPEHEIQHDLSAERVRRHAVLSRMNPLRTNPKHEFRLFGEGPRLLEQNVGVPLDRVTAEEGRGACLEFQPVFYGRNFDGGIGTEVRP